MTALEERIGEIFDEAIGCRMAASHHANLWCYWPNSEDKPCDACKSTMDRLVALIMAPPPAAERCLANVNEMGTGNIK